jgi:hypothetical protein
MKPLRLRDRLTCLLLSLCVLGASVGASLPERLCRISGQLPADARCPTAGWATELANCCQEQEAPTSGFHKAQQVDGAGCCDVSVVYFHVAPDAIGPVATLDWPDLPAGLPVLQVWRAWHGGATAAQALRLYASDASPPGRVVARTLVLALHQLRT